MWALAWVLLAALGAVTWLVVDAAPAAAHGDDADATNFRSVVRGVRDDSGSPVDVAGVTWQVLGGDALLSVHNDGDRPVVVFGYDGEPYLRVGPDGVFENRNAPTTYRNADRFDRATVPADASADARSRWVRVSVDPAYRWHDHRVHWMAPTTPPAARGAVAPVHVFDWEVPFAIDGRRLLATGTLEWFPPPSTWTWLGAALAAVVAPVLVAATIGGTRRRRRVARTAAMVVLLVVGVAAVHVVDQGLAAPVASPNAGWMVLRGMVCLAVVAVAAVAAWRGGDHTVAALVVGSSVAALTIGATDVDVLRAALVPSRAPAWLARTAVALCITLPACALVAAAVDGRRSGAVAGGREAENQ